jgi:phage N-6-adenine-methyltransferase
MIAVTTLLVPDENGQLCAFGTHIETAPAIEPKLTDCWRTPPELFEQVNADFDFQIDAASSDDNRLTPHNFTADDNALELSWTAEASARGVPPVFWCNPPYSQAGGPLAAWTDKALEESRRGATVVMLVPADTSANRMHVALRHADEVRFLDARVQFLHPVTGLPVSGNPWPSCLIVFRPHVPPDGWPGGARVSVVPLPRKARADDASG